MSDEADKQVGPPGADYEVGYGKPPSATRFQKGQSGNPKGRPKGVKNLSTMLDEELEQRVVVKENGRQKKITRRRATMKQFVNRAASGDNRALQLLINYLEEREKRAEASPEAAQLGEVEQEILSGVVERLRKSQPDNGEE